MAAEDDRLVVWFDIDNTLYSAKSKIAHEMGKLIHAYFGTLGLDDEEASRLHLEYYTTYGLAVRGLVRHHGVDPLDFDSQCDAKLPLENMISPSPETRRLLMDIDRLKARVFGLTNAYRPHAERVLRILALDDQVEDIVFCDYMQKDFVCKPEPEYYDLAMKRANITDPSKCYFIDDNFQNCHSAYLKGWGHVVHFSEVGLEVVEGGKLKQIGSERPESRPTGVEVVSNLEQLREKWPEIFKKP